jgi:3-oxoacyl-[acyl-carrier protein] reductase
VEIAGSRALVTGGGAGIGGAIVDALAREGAAVVVADVDEEAAHAAAGDLAVRADVSRDEDVRAMVAFALHRLGGLDVLVNNAGGAGTGFPLDDWGRILDLNLRGLMLATQLAIEAMRGRGGAIVNISSVAGLGTRPHGSPDYAAAKAAVARLTSALAPLADSDGIRVNCICPDWVDTPAVQRSLAAMTPERRASVPRLVPAGEIAEIVLELVRDDSLAGRIVARFADEDGPRFLPPDRRD